MAALPVPRTSSYNACMGSSKRSTDQAGNSESAAAAPLALQKAVGAQVRAVRTAQGIGQAECARNAGMDKSSMYRLETGGQNVTIETLARISLALGVGLEDLVSGVHPDPSLITATHED